MLVEAPTRPSRRSRGGAGLACARVAHAGRRASRGLRWAGASGARPPSEMTGYVPAGGISTWSMTWMTPFVALTSDLITFVEPLR